MCRGIFFAQLQDSPTEQQLPCLPLQSRNRSHSLASSSISVTLINSSPSPPPPPYPVEQTPTSHEGGEEYPPSRPSSPRFHRQQNYNRIIMNTEHKSSSLSLDSPTNARPPPSYNEEWEDCRKKLRTWRRTAAILVVLLIVSTLVNLLSIFSLWKLSNEASSCGVRAEDTYSISPRLRKDIVVKKQRFDPNVFKPKPILKKHNLRKDTPFPYEKL